MTDQNSVAVVKNEVDDTTQTISPQVEAIPTESQTPETGESELPENIEEQRRAFQEMRRELKQLKTEKDERVKSESAFDVFRPQSAPAVQPQVRVEDYYDSNSGETNWTNYNKAVNDALVNTQQMATYTAQQTATELVDENNARNKYPELFADRETEQEIADKWFAAKMRGENPKISDIAERLNKRLGKALTKAEKVGAEKALTEVSEKEKGGMSATSQTSEPARQAQKSQDFADLQMRTRRGDDEAIFQRVSQIPWANK